MLRATRTSGGDITSLYETSNTEPKARSVWWRAWVREMAQLKRVAKNFFGGHGSKIGYLFVPVVVALVWLLLCILTAQNKSIKLEDALSRSYWEEYENSKNVYKDGIIRETEVIHHVEVPSNYVMNFVMAIPFIDVNPISAHDYLKTLEWILVFSSVPIHFTIITNSDSIPYVELIFQKLRNNNDTDFQTSIITLTQIIETCSNTICPKLKVSDKFCEVLMGHMTPLTFPYLLPDLDEVIYIDRNIVFQDDVRHLYDVIHTLKGRKEGLAMAFEQSLRYMRSFGTWQRIHPGTTLGRPPPDGRPGFNVDLIIMDLEKLRASATYRGYLNEAKLHRLMKTYMYHTNREVPDLGDMVNLIAADSSNFIHTLGCEWNRNTGEDISPADTLAKKFNVCPTAGERVRAWNGNPTAALLQKTGDRTHSKVRVPAEEAGER